MKNEQKDLPLNLRVGDKLTGFEGKIIAKVEYIWGTIEYLVQPQCEDKSVLPKAEWISSNRLTPLDTHG